METKIFTIMFIDIDWVTTLNDNNYSIFIKNKDRIIKDISENNNWIFLKKLWEWYMYIYNSPSHAIISALKIKNEIKKLWQEEYWIKIWINTWEVQYKNNYSFATNKNNIDVFWTPVNLASRIKSYAKKWEILTSEYTRVNISNDIFSYTYIWKKKLKWIENKTKIYKIENSIQKWINLDFLSNIVTWTIMNTDIVWYTKTVSTQTRSELVSFLDNQRKILEPIIARSNWKIIKTIWDAYVIYFDSPTNALLAAKAIQKKIKWFNNKANDKNKIFNIRIWISTWEIYIINWEYTWIVCKIAEKLESLTKPWNIYITENTIYNINKKDIKTKYIWKKKIENKKIKTYKIDLWEFDLINFLLLKIKKYTRIIYDLLIKLIIFIIIIFIILSSLFFYLKHSDNKSETIKTTVAQIDKYIKLKTRIYKIKYKIFIHKYF